MPSYSSADVNEAKRRVEEMRKKSQNYIEPVNDDNFQNKNQKHGQKREQNPLNDVLSGLFSNSEKNDARGLILALILILSKEGADNSLILALLYILL